MASAGEENVLHENSGRRTRSGRCLPSTPTILTSTRTSRRIVKKQSQEQFNEIDESRKSTTVIQQQQREEQPQIIDQMAEIAEEDIIVLNEHDVVEEIIAPDDVETCIIYEDTEQVQDSDIYEVVQEENPTVHPETALDDKSSSFPFGSVGMQSETSEDITEQANLDNNGAVEISLLASLVGDNANSLPSVGGGESEYDVGKKDDYESKVLDNCEKMESDDSISEPAIAEDLNAGMDGSEATIVNTEMVSEDELPLATKPEINDAEEVSDEELPAPKRAELPEDAEIISEDELPAGNLADKYSVSPVCVDYTHSRKKRKASIINGSASSQSPKSPQSPQTKPLENSTIHKKDEEYNPMSPTSESNDSPPIEKKIKFDDDSYKEKDKPKANNEQHTKDIDDKEHREKERKRLPDLDKYWKAVKDDAADFTGWTYLLQYVDNESDAEAAREAYDAFLSHYPYCYGYWRKYADYEKRKGIKTNCDAVFERGLEAIPLSVDLWIHYLTHVKANRTDDESYIRTQFERAVDACGLEFRSDKLWDAYLKWENDGKHYQQMVKIYDRLLGIPTQGYSNHFDNFQDLINQHSITSTMTMEEIKRIRQELYENTTASSSRARCKTAQSSAATAKELKEKHKASKLSDDISSSEGVHSDISSEKLNVLEMDTNEDERKHTVDMDFGDLSTLSEDEIHSIKEKFISIRRRQHKDNMLAVTSRWSFEEGIKRPYFHVKPLERCQLKNWKDYLDFEIEKGDRKRILVLFERCLIACALYDEFWLKMLRYLETHHDTGDNIAITRDVYHRACEIHHPDKPSLHLMWAAFEECQNNFDKAAEILINLEKKVQNLLQIAYRRINIERRRGDYSKCKSLYEHYINTAKNKNISGSLSIKYSRFLNKICHDLDGGLKVLQQALDKDSANTRVALQMIDLALQRPKVDEQEVVSIMDKFMARDSIDPEQKVLFAQRKVEFLEDFGSTAKGLQDAQRSLQLALSKANETKKKRETSPSRKANAKDGQPLLAAPIDQPSVYNCGSAAAAANYNYNSNNSASYYGQTANNSPYAQPAQQHHHQHQHQQQQSQQPTYDNYYNHWQYGGSGYSGYNQWSGYGNYY